MLAVVARFGGLVQERMAAEEAEGTGADACAGRVDFDFVRAAFGGALVEPPPLPAPAVAGIAEVS